MTARTDASAGQGTRMPRRGLGLTVLIVNQLLAGVGVATGMALAAILTADLTGTLAMGGLAQSSSVLGAAIVAIPLAKLAVRSGRHVALFGQIVLQVVQSNVSAPHRRGDRLPPSHSSGLGGSALVELPIQELVPPLLADRTRLRAGRRQQSRRNADPVGL